MKKIKWFSFLMLWVFFYPWQLYAGKEQCPKEAIHCIYNTTKSSAKWIKVVMLPRNLMMILCLSNRDVLYLEQDDVDQNGALPGNRLTWIVSQCIDEKCAQSQPLGIDQFILLSGNKHYDADPRTYGFAFDPDYGETCTFSKNIKNAYLKRA